MHRVPTRPFITAGVADLVRRAFSWAVAATLVHGIAAGQATVNQVPKFTTSGGALGNSTIVEVGGNVGIGTVNPGAPLHVLGPVVFDGPSTIPAYLVLRATGSTDSLMAIDGGPTGDPYILLQKNGQTKWAMVADLIGENSLAFVNFFGSPATPVTRFYLEDTTGNVGIGTTAPEGRLHVVGNAKVDGNVVVNGNIGAKYQDVAEWVEAEAPIAAGTVVIAAADRDNVVRPSGAAYDTAVAGVVSAQPGVLLGEAGAGKVAVAQSGRVKVKVDASYGPVRRGDLLVSSPRPGYAMRSEAVTMGEISIHRPGTILGKALEPLERGTGEVLTLLTLQ
jgi:hypothetical protein